MGFKVKLQFWVYGDDAWIILSTNARIKNHLFTDDARSTSYGIGIINKNPFISSRKSHGSWMFNVLQRLAAKMEIELFSDAGMQANTPY